MERNPDTRAEPDSKAADSKQVVDVEDAAPENDRKLNDGSSFRAVFNLSDDGTNDAAALFGMLCHVLSIVCPTYAQHMLYLTTVVFR